MNIKHYMIRKQLKKYQRDGHRINAALVVPNSRKLIYRYVPKKYIPLDSLEKEYNGDRIHWLVLHKKKLVPFGPPKIIIENEMPTDFFMARNCEAEIQETYGLDSGLIEKVKLGIFVALILVELIVLFLIITQVIGGA